MVNILAVSVAQMDAATAKLVDAAMAEAFRDATVITVAHRLPALLETCDRVAVMSEGRVVEEGRPRCGFSFCAAAAAAVADAALFARGWVIWQNVPRRFCCVAGRWLLSFLLCFSSVVQTVILAKLSPANLRFPCGHFRQRKQRHRLLRLNLVHRVACKRYSIFRLFFSYPWAKVRCLSVIFASQRSCRGQHESVQRALARTRRRSDMTAGSGERYCCSLSHPIRRWRPDANTPCLARVCFMLPSLGM